AHDVDLVRRRLLPPPDPLVPCQVPVRVVCSDTASLHQPHEGEVEVVGDPLTPAGDVAVEQVLPTRDTAGPEVTTSREDLEVPDHRDELLTLARQVVPGIDQAKVPVDDPLHGLRPGLLGPVRLCPAVRALVDD